MNQFVKIVASDGAEVYINPDNVKLIALQKGSPNVWNIHLVGHPKNDPVSFVGDITPLLEAIRQEPFIYSLPLLDTLLGPKPKS